MHLACGWMHEAVEASTPAATRHEPSVIIDGSAVGGPCPKPDGGMVVLGLVHHLQNLIDMESCSLHQLNVLSNVLSKMRPARCMSRTLCWRCE